MHGARRLGIGLFAFLMPGLSLAQGEDPASPPLVAVVGDGPGPAATTPGPDPVYARIGRPLQLSWTAAAGPYRVTIERRVGGDVVWEKQVEVSSVSVTLAEPGLYRWRVARVDPRGPESPAWEDGYLCIVKR